MTTSQAFLSFNRTIAKYLFLTTEDYIRAKSALLTFQSLNREIPLSHPEVFTTIGVHVMGFQSHNRETPLSHETDDTRR